MFSLPYSSCSCKLYVGHSPRVTRRQRLKQEERDMTGSGSLGVKVVLEQKGKKVLNLKLPEIALHPVFGLAVHPGG